MPSFAEEQKKKWEGVFRGSILSATMTKHISYIGFADQRAQGMIGINAILMPIALTGLKTVTYYTAALVSLLTSIVVITLAIMTLFPKTYRRKRGYEDLLHFSGINTLTEKEYLDRMRETTKDPGKLTEALALDLYHLSKHVLRRKFQLLRMSYIAFLIGNSVAILFAMATSFWR